MKPERDAEMCSVPPCEKEATTATPAGPLCREHADEFAELENARYASQMWAIDDCERCDGTGYIGGPHHATMSDCPRCTGGRSK